MNRKDLLLTLQLQEWRSASWKSSSSYLLESALPICDCVSAERSAFRSQTSDLIRGLTGCRRTYCACERCCVWTSDREHRFDRSLPTSVMGGDIKHYLTIPEFLRRVLPHKDGERVWFDKLRRPVCVQGRRLWFCLVLVEISS